MEGLLILALIGWAFSKMNQKAKKQMKKQAASSISVGSPAERRLKRMEQLRAEAEKRKAQLVQEKPIRYEEGEGIFQTSMMAEETFRGSMQVESTEGECICDPELEHEREAKPEPANVYAGEIGREPLVDFSPRGMMQGFIMSEILTRPVLRAKRR